VLLAQAHAEALPNGVVCRAVWGAPFAGELEESYTMPDPEDQPDVMHVRSTIRVGDRSATTLQVRHCVRWGPGTAYVLQTDGRAQRSFLELHRQRR
jgi:hypothetical protein